MKLDCVWKCSPFKLLPSVSYGSWDVYERPDARSLRMFNCVTHTCNQSCQQAMTAKITYETEPVTTIWGVLYSQPVIRRKYFDWIYQGYVLLKGKFYNLYSYWAMKIKLYFLSCLSGLATSNFRFLFCHIFGFFAANILCIMNKLSWYYICNFNVFLIFIWLYSMTLFSFKKPEYLPL